MLDLARFIAAMVVVLYHFGFHGGVVGKYLDFYNPTLGELTKYGYLGVNVFFVISGFVIAWTAEGSRAWAFAWSRWLRVYPTFILAVLLTSAVASLANNPRFSITLPQVGAHFLVDARRLGFDFVDGVYWTIVCEMQFYVMVTVGLAVPQLRRHANLCLALWLGLGIFNEFFLRKGAVGYILLSSFSGLFVVGMMLFRFHAKRFNLTNLALFTVALIFAITMEIRLAESRFSESGTAWSPALVTLLWVSAVFILYAVTHLRFTVSIEKMLQRIGALTYPLYLLHATIGFILINSLAFRIGLLPSISLVTVGMIFISALVAWRVEPRIKSWLLTLSSRFRSSSETRSMP